MLLFWDRGILDGPCCDRLIALGMVDPSLSRAEVIAAVETEISRGRLSTVGGMAALLEDTGNRPAVFALVMLRAVLHWIAKECLRREALSPAGSRVMRGDDDGRVVDGVPGLVRQFGDELPVYGWWKDPGGDWRQRAITGVVRDVERTHKKAAARVAGFAASVAPEGPSRDALTNDLRAHLAELVRAISINPRKGYDAERDARARADAQRRGGTGTAKRALTKAEKEQRRRDRVRHVPYTADVVDDPRRRPERPDERLIREAEITPLREALARLPPNVSAALLAWVADGVTLDDAARAHGTTTKTLYNARRKLGLTLPRS